MAFPLLVTEENGPVVLYEPSAGGGWRRREIAPQGRWPAWNPTRDLVAISVVEAQGEEIRSTIELVGLDGRHQRTLHRTPRGVQPIIAPRLPHYALWSPGGGTLSYVAQSSYGLSLFLSDASGLFTGDTIINAAPIFFAWCADDNFLAVHAGEELSVIESRGSRTTAAVAEKALGFRTPAYSDDGAILAFVEPRDAGTAVMRAEFQGTLAREVALFPRGVALGFRPHTHQLAVAAAAAGDTGSFESLSIVDLDNPAPRPRPTLAGPFAAFWWSPRGDRLVVAVPVNSGDGRYSLQAFDTAGRRLATSDAFVPSPDFRTILGFFDQFSLSHCCWAPDGSAFVTTGRLAADGVSAAFGDPVPSYVLHWPVERGAPIEVLGPGSVAFFSPPPKSQPPVNEG